MNVEHPEVVIYNNKLEGLVPCVAIRAEKRSDGEIWVLCLDRGYEDPNTIIILTTCRIAGLFWLPLSKIDTYDIEEILSLLYGNRKRNDLNERRTC